MKTKLILLASGSLTALTLVSAQSPDAPAAPPVPKPILTPEQTSNVLKQLADLEKTILQQRGSSLSGIIQKLRTAASSDAAAINFVEECDKLVNIDRKDADREEARKIKEKAELAKRGESKKEEDKDGDHTTGLRLSLEYLALTLEANDAKDLASMTPKIQAFHQTLIGHGKKLKGRTGEMLMRSVAGGGGGRRGGGGLEVGVVVDAYQLDGYLHRESWPLEPGNIMRMYERVILQPAREKHKEEIGSLWEAAITTEGTFRKLRMAEGDFAVWQQQEVPLLRWARATDLVANGNNPVSGMAEMLKVIKDNPSHPRSPSWISQLRGLVAPPESTTPAVAP